MILALVAKPHLTSLSTKVIIDLMKQKERKYQGTNTNEINIQIFHKQSEKAKNGTIILGTEMGEKVQR